MKKQHFYRLSAILLFLCIFLGIMPRHALQATAAENEGLPKEGVLYTLSCIDSEKQIVSLEFFIGGVISIEKNLGGSLRLSWNDAPDVKNLGCAFLFEEVQDGYYIIIPAAAPGFCLQVYLENERKTVYGSKFDNKPEQLWTITPFEGGIQISNAAVPDLVLGLSDDRPINVHMTTGEWAFSLEESQIVFPEPIIRVKAPDFWAPGTVYKSSTIVFMPREEDGWYSWYHNGKGISIENLAISSPMAQVLPTDFSVGVQIDNPDQDYWVVISDDPNVEGDLTYKIYDYNPDNPPPEEDPLPKEGVLYTLSWAESEKRIFSLEFPLYHAINTDTLACGPLVTSLYDKDFPYSKPDVTNLTCAFSFKEVQNGYYIIIPATAPDVCLQVSLGSTYKTLYGRKFDNQPEQLWTITPCEGGIQISNAAVPDLVLGLRDGVGSMDVCMTTGEWVFSLEESQIVFPEHRIHVKAPDFWAPCIFSSFGSAFMPKEEDGWYSYYYCKDHIMIENLAISSSMAQILPPDFKIHLVVEEPSKDYWVVISDDPNVDGDLTYKIYDYNPDGEPPKTADTVTLAVPAFTLLASTIAMAWLFRRKKTV